MHSCRQRFCDEPHYENDRHSGDCLCALCHDHDWSQWNVYPECDGCLVDLAQWIHENTDFTGCPIPEVCQYRKACDDQFHGRAA